jgi:gliding motility-associated-like protein
MKRLFLFFLLFIFTCFRLFAQTDKTYNNGATVDPIIFSGTQCFYTWVNDNPNIGLAATGTGNIPAFTAINNTNSPIVATITATPNISGLAYITNNNINTVSVIDLATNSVVKTIAVGATPTGVAVNPINDQVYITNSFEKSVSVINTLDNTVKATIPVGSYPFSVHVRRDGQRAYVPSYNEDNIYVINTTTNTVIGKLPGGSQPLIITSNSDASRLYIANQHAGSNDPTIVTIVNTQTGNIISTLNVGYQPYDIVCSPDDKWVYVSLYDGNKISVISTATNTIVGTISPGFYPKHLALSADGSLLYVRAYTNTSNGALKVISTANYTTLASVPLPDQGSTGLSVSPDGKRIVLVNQVQATATIVDLTSNTIVANVATLGKGSLGIGNFILGGNNCAPVTFKITVNPSAIISTSGNMSAMTTNYGTASSSTLFMISGQWLTSAITITAPTGFELSIDNINFSNAITYSNVSGTVTNEKVYVRLKSGIAAGTYSGSITLRANTAADVNIAIPQSEVKPVLLTVKAEDKTRVFGKPNPTFTATYSGFVNSENQSALTALPVFATLANDSSPIGQYPITIGGAVANNYTFNYIDAILTITEVPVVNNSNGSLGIPNTFTPNGDGINDTWNISNLKNTTINTITIFNRYGQEVFFSKGSSGTWDGNHNNKGVPDGVYYYIITTNTKGLTFSGNLTVLR